MAVSFCFGALKAIKPVNSLALLSVLNRIGCAYKNVVSSFKLRPIRVLVRARMAVALCALSA